MPSDTATDDPSVSQLYDTHVRADPSGSEFLHQNPRRGCLKLVLWRGEYSLVCLQGGRVQDELGGDRHPTRFATARVSNEAVVFLVPRAALSEDSHRLESDAQAPLFFAANFSYGLGSGPLTFTVTGRWQ